MASSNVISISFKVADGENGLKKLTMDANELRKVMEDVVGVSTELDKKILNFAAIATGIDSVSNTLSSWLGTLGGLTQLYSAQIEAETKLAVNMRNTMDAREEDIQSIKDLCSAQQQLGVIGDEVQLAGAQELATYLSKKESLEQLIPVMNDMLAQQYGLAASQENAAQIATMLGKVMDGQVGALSRYGYKFDETQEQILKFGTESERAAVLVDVISASVGGMNAELAKTDVGKMQQINNQIGDYKEQLGSYAQSFMPILTGLSNAAIAIGGIIKLYNGAKTAMIAMSSVGKKAASEIAGSFKAAKLFVVQFSAAVSAGTNGLRLFAIAWKSTLISTGVGIAIVAVTSIIACLASTAEDAADSIEKLDDATEDYTQAATAAKVQIDADIQELGRLMSSHEDTGEAVQRLNERYGEFFGIQTTAEDFYRILTEKSQAYVKQMGYEAQARSLASKIAEASIKKELAAEEMKRLHDAGLDKKIVNDYSMTGGVGQVSGHREVETAEYEAARKKAEEVEREEAKLQEQLDIVAKLTKENSEEMSRGLSGANKEIKVSKMSWTQVTAAIKETEKKLQDATDPAKIKQLRAYNDQLQARKKILDRERGFSKETPDKVLPKGSAADLNKRISEIKAKIDITLDSAKKQTLITELVDLEEQLKKISGEEYLIRFKLENPEIETDGKTEANKAVPVEMPVTLIAEIDGEELKQQMDHVVQGVTPEEVPTMPVDVAVADGLGGMAQMLGTVSQLTNESAAAWLQWGANVLDACRQALPAIMAVTGAKAAESAVAVPIIGWTMAGLAIASVLASFATLPKFADGGIISGPTIGLMGEYAGAANNPEVVAPLDKLRSMLQPVDGGIGGKVTFRIDGRALVGVLEKENNIKYRS